MGNVVDVVPTFDDGYEEHVTLARKGILELCFVIACFRKYMGRELLRPEEMREIVRLRDRQPHNDAHRHGQDPRDVMLRELIESKKTLSDLLGEEVTSLAYPYGPHSTETAELARQAYRVVRTTYLGKGRNYVLFDEHGCVNAFNLRLQNLYEIMQLRRQEILVLLHTYPALRN